MVSRDPASVIMVHVCCLVAKCGEQSVYICYPVTKGPTSVIMVHVR